MRTTAPQNASSKALVEMGSDDCRQAAGHSMLFFDNLM